MANIPPVIRFYGDREKALGLKSQALQFGLFIGQQAEIGGIPFASRSTRLSDGSIISVITKKESIYSHRSTIISIITQPSPQNLPDFEVYMESGFIEVLNIAPCNPNTYKPSLLHFNYAMKSVDSKLNGTLVFKGNPPLLVSNGLEEGESKVTGCLKKVSSILRCETTYTESGAFCDTEEIRRKKLIQLRIPSSNFSGKLRLYIQAMYGSPTRNDYYTIEGLPLLNIPLFVGDGIQLHYTNTDVTSGLISGKDFTYWLVQVPVGDVSSITAYKLVPDATGKKIRNYLIANLNKLEDDDLKRLEAYLLATCTLEEQSSIIEVVDGNVVQGQPIAYGWHFNWDGSQADIILHRDNLPTDQAWHAYHYNLTFTEEEDGSLTAKVLVKFSDKQWYGVTNKAIYFPDYFTGNMGVFVNPKNTPFSGWNIDYNWQSDIYCYYDQYDELQLLNVKSDFTESKPKDAVVNSTCGVQDAGVAFDREIGAGILPKSYNSSISVGDVTLSYNTAVSSPNNSTLEQWVYNAPLGYEPLYPIGSGDVGTNRAIPDDYTQYLCGGISQRATAIAAGLIVGSVNGSESGRYYDDNGTNRDIYITYNTLSNSLEIYQYSGVMETKTVVHTAYIPFNDCSKVVIGEKKRRYRSSLTKTHTDTLARTNGETIWVDWYSNSTGKKVVLEIYGPYVNDGNRIFNQIAGTGSVTATPEESNTVTLAEPGKGILLVNENPSMYEDSTFFDVNYASDPRGYFSAYGATAVMGATRFKISGFVDVGGNDYIYDTSVGWA